MAASTRLLAPTPGSAWAPRRPGAPIAIDAGTFALATLPTSPFWARRYIRRFLESCRGIGIDTADTAELLVSELVTNAVRFASGPVPAQEYSDRVNAGIIWLSVRHFGEGLLIEVFDTDASPPILTDAAGDAENGRGLFIVDALSKQWSYFFPPGGGKVVYCLIEIPMPQRLPISPRPVRDWIRHGPGRIEPTRDN
jgi:anti-sigma regulatory factor (Ser/Thr protein kinase)